MGLSWGKAMIHLRKTLMLAPLAILAACGDATGKKPDAEEERRESLPSLGPQLASGPPVPLADWLVEEVGFGDIAFYEGEYDLDGDGTAEILAFLTGPMHCGSGGCNLLVLRPEGGGYRKLGDLSVSRLPVGVFPESTRGWRDLAVNVGGGGLEGAVMRVPFDGQAYASNPTVAPAEPSDEPFDLVLSAGFQTPVGE